LPSGARRPLDSKHHVALARSRIWGNQQPTQVVRAERVGGHQPRRLAGIVSVTAGPGAMPAL